MAKAQEARAELLNLLYARHLAGTINWVERDKKGSYEAEVGPYTIHLDRELVNRRAKYTIWVFDGESDLVDRIDMDTMMELKPEATDVSSFYMLISSIVSDLQQKKIAVKLSGVIEALKQGG
ncbi:MAG TPA: hypothetical protein VF655_11925 [Allosphingosinicella sp.]|jgi:hypothetical protein